MAIRPNRICARDENVSAGLFIFFPQNDLQTRPNLSAVAFPEQLQEEGNRKFSYSAAVVFELINGKKHFHPECVLYYT